MNPPSADQRPAIRSIASRTLTFGAVLATGLGSLVALPAAASAQESDFLFRSPRITLGIHGGFHMAGADSEVFDFTTDNLTVEPGDFDSPAFRGEIAVRLTDRLDFSVDASRSSSEVRSESRDFIGTDDLPIVQTTEFSQTPVAFNLKYYLGDRGRTVGNFAWIPQRFTAYLGAGLGFAAYSFTQHGEFVIEETLDIVNARLESSSTGGLAQVLGGVEFTFTPRAILVLDGRYRWASADMRSDWIAFEDIDLSGLSLSLGLGLRL